MASDQMPVGVVLTPFTPPDVPSAGFVRTLIGFGADKATIKVAAAGRQIGGDMSEETQRTTCSCRSIATSDIDIDCPFHGQAARPHDFKDD